ncbi:hypothetical protein ARMSODRAFT_1027622 [Armillaria solidipes]|uniref:Uncharacterized protein n=1 Tax=Armillaria solidipes TaxID=1076256 RepID=A0A2H3B5T5_9AGAR|nr:hypothetical protein ARMSODRAFT_1027622 [Armillaria solidipes]
MSSTASSSSSTPTVSTSPSSTDKQPLIAGVTLASVAVLVIAIILFFTFLRRKSSSSGPDNYILSRHAIVVDRSHISLRITLFGAPGGEILQIMHAPWYTMRIAIRRSDGVWTFPDPRVAAGNPGGELGKEHRAKFGTGAEGTNGPSSLSSTPMGGPIAYL